MPCGREIRLRRVKSLRRWGFISFHLMRSGKYHNLQSKLFHRERSERFHFLFGQNALNIGRGACQGEPHRAACGRWSGALSRKKQRALRSAPPSSVAPYHSFPPLAKTHSLRTSSSPPKASLFGHPCKATMSLTERVVDLSPMGAQKQKILSKDGIFCFIQYLSLVKWGKFPMICTFKAFFGKIVLNKAQLNILMSRVWRLLGYVCL